MNKLLQSKTIRWILIALGGLVFVLGAFSIGVRVGYQEARFSYEWGARYERDFGGPPRGFFGFFGGGPRVLISAHGALGTVTDTASSSFSVIDEDNILKDFVVSSTTFFRAPRSPAQFSDLHVGDQVIVIGMPDSQGRIEAKFVRIVKEQ